MNNFSKIPMSFQRELTNTLLEEACRQWCDCIADAPERKSGEGFADFYHEIYSQKAAEYLATMLVDEKIESVGELFCTEQAIITLRPASPDEVGLFYSQMETAMDAEIATVGHLRIDFGHKGSEFWSTWWEHNGNELNTPAFKAELEAFVNEMRTVGPLQNLREMQSYCYAHEGSIASESQHYGYIAESEQYRYCLRCTPVQGEYQSYLYIYDKHQQELLMQQEPPQQSMEMGGMH